jgi:hypothetical protein
VWGAKTRCASQKSGICSQEASFWHRTRGGSEARRSQADGSACPRVHRLGFSLGLGRGGEVDARVAKDGWRCSSSSSRAELARAAAKSAGVRSYLWRESGRLSTLLRRTRGMGDRRSEVAAGFR